MSTIVLKESIMDFSFFKEDVLKTEELKKIRAFKLDRAVKLGNIYRGKVKIFFRTIDSLSQSVETTVWAWAEDYISLKGGICLPIRAIEDIDF